MPMPKTQVQSKNMFQLFHMVKNQDLATTASLIATNKSLFDNYCNKQITFRYGEEELAGFTESHSSVHRFKNLTVLMEMQNHI